MSSEINTEALEKLIGQKVVAYIPNDDDTDTIRLEGEVLAIDIDDFYFYEKNESISITVDIMPNLNKEKNISIEDYENIPLEYIHHS